MGHGLQSVEICISLPRQRAVPKTQSHCSPQNVENRPLFIICS